MFFTGFPFDDFGSNNPMGGRSRKSEKSIDNSKFYELLEINKDASLAEIKKAYKRIAIKTHPDKGGDPEKFKAISRAYEVLSDPEKRKIYDELGEEGLEGDVSAGPTDIFDLFFGGSNRRQKTTKKKGDAIVSTLKVTLEQLYKGASRKVAINKDVICDECCGVGGPQDAIQTCSSCDGQGVKIQVRNMGNMFQQIHSQCAACKGQGKYMPQNKKCKKCTGVCTVKERKVLDVFIEAGAPNRHKIVVSGEADEKPNEIPGDLVFVINEQDHNIFKRKGVDLEMVKHITLYEALTGFKFAVKHLDERTLIVENEKGQIIRPNDTKVVKEEGMPTHKNPFVKGDLLIKFEIDFPLPHQINEHNIQILKKILPQPLPIDVSENDENVEVHTVKDVNINDKKPCTNKEAYDEDEDDASDRPQGVQCRQQ